MSCKLVQGFKPPRSCKKSQEAEAFFSKRYYILLTELTPLNAVIISLDDDKSKSGKDDDDEDGQFHFLDKLMLLLMLYIYFHSIERRISLDWNWATAKIERNYWH